MSLSRKPKPCGCNRLCECHKPPSERSTLKRTPLRRGKLLERTGRINPVSDKRKRENRKRRKVLESFGPNPKCARCGQPADDAHEVLSRGRGGDAADPDNIVPLCRPCHDWAHRHPKAAHDEGLLKHSWED